MKFQRSRKEGCYSKHNTGYWTGRQFLGYGPSAFSYWEGSRFRNIAHLGKYVELLRSGNSPVDFTEQLDPQAHLRDSSSSNCVYAAGVHLDHFEREVGILSPETHSMIQQLEGDGYLNHHQAYSSYPRRESSFTTPSPQNSFEIGVWLALCVLKILHFQMQSASLTPIPFT